MVEKRQPVHQHLTAAGLRYGGARKSFPRLLSKSRPSRRPRILPLDVPADVEYGGIRAELEAVGRPIGPNDLLIAAHAHARGATPVTANVGEFARVRGLSMENWLA
ncbi:MAG: type II toxin-antitoxin system VapC family toxin [Oxalobacteraceae bacterium]|uniref:PIN domain-containing protein n=1 Tax=Sphingomonas sp. Leaf208 TaxID=1735679 RepID=UPI0010DC713D|nr:PIN domain-containing protein [Sphingomonas sp. Leaf208]RYF11195.1 MAG: type II toxin-antitoxin system VapC family toxin [Oxalobacteraceae bacterium]